LAPLAVPICTRAVIHLIGRVRKGSMSMSCLYGTLFVARSAQWLSEVKRIRGKKQPLTAARAQGLRDQVSASQQPARATRTLKLKPTRPMVLPRRKVSR